MSKVFNPVIDSTPPIADKVPVVGSVTFVAAVEAKVVAKVPDVLKSPAVLTFPPKVMVFPVLAIPVPTLAPSTMPVTFPAVLVTVVWSPVLVPKMASNFVLSAALILPAVLVVAALIELVGALPPEETIGAVTPTLVTVPVVGVVQVGVPAPPEANNCPEEPAANRDVVPAAD